MSLRSRAHAVAAASVVVVVALAGCSLVSGFVSQTRSATVKPATGDCWTSSVAKAQQASTWTDDGSVPCTLTHQLYTYAVASVTSSATTWKGSNGDADPTILQDAFSACDADFGGFISSKAGGRLSEYFFLPWRPPGRRARGGCAATSASTASDRCSRRRRSSHSRRRSRTSSRGP